MRLYFFIIVAITLLGNKEMLAQSNSLLWKIEASHLSKPSYLYGTMHSRDKRAHQFGDSVLAKLNECDAVALELLTSEMEENSFAMLQLMMMEDTTLDMLLSEEDYKIVNAYAEENLEMYSMFINKMKPIFTSALLTEGMMRNDKPYTVDDYFGKKAEDGGKLTIGIETMEEQMNALGQISLREQAQMLLEQIKSEGEDSLLFEQLMEHYKNQDLDAMMKIYKSEEIPEMFDEALIIKRNQVMAHRMDSIIRMQPTFNAVGALHLAGNEGVIELLKKKGYKMTPVFSAYSGTDEPEIYFPEKWYRLKSKNGNYKVEFPKRVDEYEGVTYSANGTTNHAIAMFKDTLEHMYVEFSIMWEVLGKDLLKMGGDSLYTLKITGIKNSKHYKLVNQKNATYQKFNIRECEFQIKSGLNLRYRMILVGDKFYMIGIVGSPEFVNSAEAEKFYQSLNLL